MQSPHHSTVPHSQLSYSTLSGPWAGLRPTHVSLNALGYTVENMYLSLMLLRIHIINKDSYTMQRHQFHKTLTYSSATVQLPKINMGPNYPCVHCDEVAQEFLFLVPIYHMIEYHRWKQTMSLSQPYRTHTLVYVCSVYFPVKKSQ